MDARRLGAGPRIPLAWLAQAAPAYLTDTEREDPKNHGLAPALSYVTTPWNDIPGIFSPVQTSADPNQRNRPTGRSGTRMARPQSEQQGPLYRLADYLDQHGSRQRADTIPPVGFWTAAAHHAHADDLDSLSNAAWWRGLYRDAAQLNKHATTHGSAEAAATLVYRLRELHPTDVRPAQWAAAHVTLDDPYAVARLLDVLWNVEAYDQVEALAARAVGDAALNEPYWVEQLLYALRAVGVQDQLDALQARNPAADVYLDKPGTVARLLSALRSVKAQDQVMALASRAAADAALTDPYGVAQLLEVLVEVGAQAQALASRVAADVSVDDPGAVARLLNVLAAEAQGEVVALASRAVADVSLDSTRAVETLLEVLRTLEAEEQFVAQASRAVADVSFDDAGMVALLLNVVWKVEAQDQGDALLARNPAADASLDDADSVAWLLNVLWQVGAQDQAEALAARAAAD
ncbi:hypothetical protein ACWGH9_26085, partial [Streptomyces chryseus]